MVTNGWKHRLIWEVFLDKITDSLQDVDLIFP